MIDFNSIFNAAVSAAITQATQPLVERIAALETRLTEAGLSPRKIVDFAPAGPVIARFFFIADPDGYQIEVLERGGRYL